MDDIGDLYMKGNPTSVVNDVSDLYMKGRLSDFDSFKEIVLSFGGDCQTIIASWPPDV